MPAPFEIIYPQDGPYAGKVVIVTSQENFTKFQDVLKSAMGAMSGASKVRDLVQGGLGQLFAAAAMLKR